jgi:hypothetical protein|tara:strand:- start:522 stop:647 length:126 start_codon:yes stop_codon:yes gene_type:complete
LELVELVVLQMVEELLEQIQKLDIYLQVVVEVVDLYQVLLV